MGLIQAKKRARRRVDDAGYLDDWTLSGGPHAAILACAYNALFDLARTTSFLPKNFATDGLSFDQPMSAMTRATVEEKQPLMNAGRQSPEGVRCKMERR